MWDSILFMALGVILLIGAVILWRRTDPAHKNQIDQKEKSEEDRASNDTWRNLH